MALTKILPDQKVMTPDRIISLLFYFHDQAHFNHLQIRRFSRHKALDELYTGIETFKDEIAELLLGYIAPGRIERFEKIPVNVNMTDEQLLDSLCKFADEVYEYGEQTKWWALSNKAAELSGLGYKVKYLLTLA